MPATSRQALCAAAALLATLVAAAYVAISWAQAKGEERDDTHPAAGEFHFARMIYQDRAGYGGGGFFRRGRGRGWWQQDWPAADTHFTQAIRRLTRIDAGEYVESTSATPACSSTRGSMRRRRASGT